MKVFRISGRDLLRSCSRGPTMGRLNESLPHKRKRRQNRTPVTTYPPRLNESLPHKRKRRGAEMVISSPPVAWASMKVFRISGRDSVVA